MNRLACLAAVGLIALGATACGAATVSSAAPASDEPEQADIVVGVLPIVDVAPVYLAIDRGLFAAEGLDVKVEIVQGGAAAIPALVSGDLDISYGNWVSFLLANQEGIRLRAVAAGVSSSPGFTEFLAMPDSELADNPAGLAGTTIALNTLNNIGELALRSTLQANDIDVSEVDLLEVPFPDMGAALERGDVDVIWASEPVPTTVKDALGAVVVADSYTDEMESFPVAGYQATADFVASNPRTVAAFERGLAAAIALIEEDPDVLTDTIVSYAELPRDVVERLALPSYESAIDASHLARVRDQLVTFGMLDAGLAIEELVASADPPD